MKTKLAERDEDAELVPRPVRPVGARTWRTARQNIEPVIEPLRTKSGVRAKVTVPSPPASDD